MTTAAPVHAARSEHGSESSRPDSYRFDRYQLRRMPLQLFAGDEPVGLQPQPTRALLLLVERAGSVVSREDLRAHLWGLDAHLDHEQAINFTIRKIRAALGDDPARPRFLETVPRAGYRFVARVERLAEVSSAGRRGRVGLWIATAAVGALAAIGLGWSLPRSGPGAERGPRAAAAIGADVPEEVRASYLRARFLIDQQAPEQVEQGIALLEEAALAAPRSASIHLAMAQGLLRSGGTPFRDYMLPAADAARRALELDPSLAGAHGILAAVSFFLDHAYDTSAEHLGAALLLDPGLASAHQMHGLYLSSKGRHDEAITAVRRAVELDPEVLFAVSDLAETLFRARRWQEAIDQAQRLLSIEPQSRSSHWIVIDALTRIGRPNAAVAQVGRYYRSFDLEPPPTLEAAYLRGLRHMERLREEGRPMYTVQARFALALGRRDEAIALLYEACREPDWELPFAAVSPRFDALREHPRWPDIPCLPAVGG